MPNVFRYGTFPSNFSEVYPAEGPVLRGTIAMIHGGWWRARHDLHLMDGLCELLAADGWRVGNVEFRRTEGIPGDVGGWPETFDDVSLALSMRAPVPNGLPTIAVGHSAGGHLALLAAGAGLVDAAVALAPITDLYSSEREGFGEGASALFLGATPDDNPELFAAASPLRRVPLRRRQLVVHGRGDTRVPIEQSRAYVAAARAAGDDVDFVELADTDHFQLIDPTHSSWSLVRSWINEFEPAP
jgi:dipeptidyl aminopeptidase/acylaminoacyl peptidase